MSVVPVMVLSAADVEQVLQVAALAPSVLNSQPWRFRILPPDTIELHADPNQQRPATDPEGRELRLSCGAALLT
ncbi:MAG: nitroreductase family protein [Pseudonocardiaceae bacterium]